MAYTTIDKPSDYFNTVIWTGDGTSSRGITGVNFRPDFVWLKRRNTTGNQNVYDVIRGATTYLLTDTNQPENTISDRLTSFDSDGFTVGNSGNTNASSSTYVAWNWLTDNTTGSSNTDGDITSTVSANTTAGFSIVSFTGTAAAATVGHGLGAAPKMMLLKNRDDTSTSWVVYHETMGGTKYMSLDLTSAQSAATNTMFDNTDPTSSVFSVRNSNRTNGSSDDMIAYCFAEKQGYSKIGSYKGNGNANGTFVYTGFKPAWIMLKEATNTSNWNMYDNQRSQPNQASSQGILRANLSSAEFTGSTALFVDFLSNGFKFRGNSVDTNRSGGTFIYLAFAESPFVSSSGIPTTAV